MTDTQLSINPEEITGVLRRHLEGFRPEVEKQQVGRITEVGDGIARISGLPNTAVNELLEFEGGVLGLALNLDEDSIGAVVLGDIEHIEEGQSARATGRILSVPVGDGLLGRVVDPLGQPIDGRGPISSDASRRLEVQAPGIVARQPVKEPLQTGIKAIDAMTPVGRGQRQLIIGDRKTGKTAIAIDTIINQRGQGVKCIYVAAGPKGSTVADVVASPEERGAVGYTAVGTAPEADPAQIKAMKAVAGTLKIDLAQFRELEAFASFGSELDKVSQAQLDRGYRLTELLKQGQRQPMPVEEQVVVIFAGTRGFLDDIPVDDIGRFERELLEDLRARCADLLKEIRESGNLPGEDKLSEAITGFKERFVVTEKTEDEHAADSGD